MWALLVHMELSLKLLLARVFLLGLEYIEDQLTDGREAIRWNSTARWPLRTTLRSPHARMRRQREGGRGGRAFTLGMRVIGAISICARCTRLRTSLVRDLRTQAIVIVDRTGNLARVEASLALVRSHRIIEYARTGAFFSDPSLGVR